MTGVQTCALPIFIVDADHGYGNALNAMRTVQELEHAGVSCMSIEDTVLPTPFGQTKETLTSIAEGEGKLRAAVAGRSDPSLIIAGRTSALKIEGVESVLARVKAYSQTGVDAIFIVGLEKLDQLGGRVARLDAEHGEHGAVEALGRGEVGHGDPNVVEHRHEATVAGMLGLDTSPDLVR